MAVTYRTATSTTATFPPRYVLVVIRGSTLESCADAAHITRRRHKSQNPRSIFIVHLLVLLKCSVLRASGQSHVAWRGTTAPRDSRKGKLLEKSMLGPGIGSGTKLLDMWQRLIVKRNWKV